jgi:hypothetical protein
VRERAARLERHAAVPADCERKLDDPVGAGERGIDIAIGLAHERRLGVEPRREAGDRTRGIEARHHGLDFRPHQRCGILGAIGIGGEDDGERLADIAHEFARQDVLAIGLEPGDPGHAEIDRRQGGNVRGGPDRGHAVGRLRRRHVNGREASERDRRAHYAHVELARKRQIGDEARRAAKQRLVLDPAHGSADIGRR